MSNNELTEKVNSTATMPVIFVGHGSPMNALADNNTPKLYYPQYKILKNQKLF